ncbi:hypothetical protein [Azospirillum baldaniorum]|uniref:hypothetical protein n=1 Tax=Azospirillum baldaniorum TaxID=1064539 RepID=UPI001644F7AB|nr:hypothetical protein [Azospirillum baldaniorum]
MILSTAGVMGPPAAPNHQFISLNHFYSSYLLVEFAQSSKIEQRLCSDEHARAAVHRLFKTVERPTPHPPPPNSARHRRFREPKIRTLRKKKFVGAQISSYHIPVEAIA